VVEPEGARFWVALIPETLTRTTLGGLEPGRRLHVEVDAIGKWVERLLAAGVSGPWHPNSHH
jgi:riboflavin synthase